MELLAAVRESPVNERLPDRELEFRRLRNRLRHLTGRADTVLGRCLCRSIAFLRGSRGEAARAHVERCFHEAGLGDDNRRLDEERQLGMARFASAYF